MDASDAYVDTAAMSAGVSSAPSVWGTTNVDRAFASAIKHTSDEIAIRNYHEWGSSTESLRG